MNTMPAHSSDGSNSDQPFYYLRQRNAQRYWNGSEWANRPEARSFFSLDAAFSIARGLRGSLDLMVLFPSSAGQIVIPLGEMN